MMLISRKAKWDFRLSLLISLAIHLGLALGIPLPEVEPPLPAEVGKFRPVTVRLVRLTPPPSRPSPQVAQARVRPQPSPSPGRPAATTRPTPSPRPAPSPQRRPQPSTPPRSDRPLSAPAPRPTLPRLTPAPPRAVPAPLLLPSRPGSEPPRVAPPTAPSVSEPLLSVPAPASPTPVAVAPTPQGAMAPASPPLLPQPALEMPSAVTPPPVRLAEKQVATSLPLRSSLEEGAPAAGAGEKPTPTPAVRLAQAQLGTLLAPSPTPPALGALPQAVGPPEGPAPLEAAGPPSGRERVLIAGGFPLPPSAGGGEGVGKAAPSGTGRRATAETTEGQGEGSQEDILLATAPEGGGYTGLVIDARGLGVKRTMSPAVLTPDGRVIFGRSSNPTPREEVISQGILGYYPSLAAARRSGRVGENPLIVRAIARGEHVLKGDVVISPEDALRIWEENRKSHFLERNRVAIVLD